MNNLVETLLGIAMGLSLPVAIFLLNTGRAVKAIELCKETLVLLNNNAMSTKQQFGKLIYGGIYEVMYNAYCCIHDSENSITYGKKLLVIYCECGKTVCEGNLTYNLAQLYMIKKRYVEAKELFERVIAITRETGDKKAEARTNWNLGYVFQSLGDYINAKEYYQRALTISMEFGDKKAEAKCYGNLGTVFISLFDYVKAKEYLEKALEITLEAGDREGEATSYENLGAVFQYFGDYVKAKEYTEKALEIKLEVGDRAGVATSYGNLGEVFKFLGDSLKAKEYLEKALEIMLEVGDRAGEATSYLNLGAVFRSLGDYAKAKEYLKKALEIKLEVNDRAGVASSYGYLGEVFKSLGDSLKAKEYLEKAIAINVEIGDRAGVAACYVSLGYVFASLGNYVKAKEYSEKSLAIKTDIGDVAGKAASYEILGEVFVSLGEYSKAYEYFKKALTIHLEIGNKAGEAENYGTLGTVYLGMRKYSKSIEYFEKALAIKMEIGDIAGEAAVNGNLGIVFEYIGDNVKAKEVNKKALAIIVEIGDRKLEAVHYLSLGNMFNSLGEYVMAEEYLGKAVSLSQDITDGETEFQCYCRLTLTKLSQEKLQEAFSYLFQSIEKCEDLRSLNAYNDQINISFADMHIFPYELLSGLFCTFGNPNSGLYAAELGRARALADLMATKYSAEKSLSANPQSWIGIENVMTRERNCTCLYISYHDRRVLLWILKTSGVISFREITVDEKTLHKRLAKPAFNLDDFFALMAGSFRSFGILPEEVCEDRSINRMELAESDSSQEEDLTTLRHTKDEKDSKLSLTWLHETLINPVSDLLGEPEIIVVPDRNLYRVPFAALRDENGKYLSHTFRIRIVPSLTTLKLIQDSPADYHSQTGALIVGDPAVGEVLYNGRLTKRFVPLPCARKEAEMVGRLLGHPPLLGAHASKQSVLQKIHSVSLIHFAAHGDAERGEIVLAPSGCTIADPSEDDYLLRMSDVSKVKLRAKLVVLSCCHSGRGQIRAEGVVGIARAFLGAGARSVLVALWALEDRATEQLMNCFYEHLVRGQSASVSLYEAMKWMRDNGFTKVSDWAPFMLVGDNVAFDFGK